VEGHGGPRIIQDVALNQELRGGTVVLHDINDEALEDMYQWGTRALDVARAELEKTQRLEEALRGLDATALDLEIPARYGVVQTVGDTVGPGGLFRGLRNIPVVVQIARAAEEHCADAVLLNLTNPLTVLTRAVSKATSIVTSSSAPSAWSRSRRCSRLRESICHSFSSSRFQHTPAFGCRLSARDLVEDCGVTYLGVFC
jgi:Family 4 glycosyl hydrolase